MLQNPMATFHAFPRLPMELRIMIWGFATEDRVLRVRKTWFRRQGYWSPALVPAVTRASRESRKYCSYRRAFIIDSSPRYLWVNFECDVVQMRRALLLIQPLPERDVVRHLRIEVVNEHGLDEGDLFYHEDQNKVWDFPRLETFDLLVGDELCAWTDYIKETLWGACPRGNVRIVDGKTGEWIDEETSGAYQDYIDTGGGKFGHYTRVVDDEDEEDREERVEAMKRLQMPLPRINLNY